jgi:colanic acid/amylovoran biosynthesis glycosyltransferase
MSRPWRIAMFVGSFPVISETFIVRQITGLLDAGHQVDLYADTRTEPASPVHPEVRQYGLLERTTFMDMPPETAPWEMPVWPITGRTWPPGSAHPVHNMVRVLRALPKSFRCLVRAPRLAWQAFRPAEYRYQAASLSALYRLAVLSARRKRYDVLHAHFGPVANSFRFARELWRAPLVVSFHGYDFSTLPRKEGAGVYRKLFDIADALTANSEYTLKKVEELGAPRGRLHKLPVGLDPREIGFRERSLTPGEPVRLLTVGRLVAIKGHEYAIQAVAWLREQGRNIRYVIVGDGPLRKKLESLVKEQNAEEIVTLRGAADSAEVGRLLHEAHLFVLASVSIEGDQEGQGLVLQEAQASGLPVVATQHGALPEGMLPGRSGFLVPERDVSALAERLGYLVDHPELWPEMGRQGRQFVEERYDIRRLNRRLIRLYKGVIQDFSAAGQIRR